MDAHRYREQFPDIIKEQVVIPHWADGTPNEDVAVVAQKILTLFSSPREFGKKVRAIIPRGSVALGYADKEGAIKTTSDLDLVLLIDDPSVPTIERAVVTGRMSGIMPKSMKGRKLDVWRFNINEGALRRAFEKPDSDLLELLGYLCLSGFGAPFTTRPDSRDGLEEARATVRGIFADAKYTKDARKDFCRRIAEHAIYLETGFSRQDGMGRSIRKMAQRTGQQAHPVFQSTIDPTKRKYQAFYEARLPVWERRIARVFELRIS